MSELKSSRRSPRPERASPRTAREIPKRGINLTPAQQEGIFGVMLISIGLLTALGAVELSRGSVLDNWTNFLRMAFGGGRFIAPVFFGGFGVFLFLDSLDLRPEIGWERPIGLILLFFVLLTGLQLLFGRYNYAEGGGWLGYALSNVLVGAIGLLGTGLVLVVMFCIGLIMLLDIPLARIFAWGVLVARSLRAFWEKTRRAWFKRTPKPKSAAKTNGRTVLPTLTRTESVRAELPDAPPRAPIAARIVGGQTPTAATMVHREWRLPDVKEILEESIEQEISAQEIRTKVRQIEETLAHFGVPAKVIEVNQGPTITQFGVEPGFVEQKGGDGSVRRTKVKVSRISALQHDLELALAAAPVRVEAPVPGKPIVGIEVPNSQTSLVSLRGVVESDEFRRVLSKSRLAFALGQDVSGQPVVADLSSMPHLLISGATGSGKSVCVNALIACLLLTNTPDDLKFVMIDPKRVELSAFNGIPHLLTPVVVDMDLAVAALQTAVREMDQRYKKFALVGARNLEAYHQITKDNPDAEKLPYLILVVDELADLMMVSPDEVERTITRLAQMARATGIHLVLATQRPSVDVVTGLIKANFPSRISFAVTSQIDSRVVLDTPGAEKLLGKGDMLYMASDSSKLSRLQGCFLSDREISELVAYWMGFIESTPAPTDELADEWPSALNVPRAHVSPSSVVTSSLEEGAWSQGGLWQELKPAAKSKPDEDELLEQAIALVQANDRASVSLLQRKLRIGYSRAARLMDLLVQKGYVGSEAGTPSKGREVLKKETNASPPPPEASPREFEQLDGFDDWSDEDWTDLDKA